MKKTICLLLSILLGMSVLTGCHRDDDDREVDETMTQLYVALWDGGFGSEWLRAAATRFEEAYKDVQIDGKTGVQVFITPSKSLALDGAATAISGMEDDIFFIEQCNYYEFIANNTALDITDAVTTPLTEFGETRSIADKMTAQDRSFYGAQQDGEQRYYGLPWYESFFGIQYDINIFEENRFYLAAEGEGRDGFIINKNTPRSKGPDGKTGIDPQTGADYTLDDGLPATYDEFFKLCDKIAETGITPLIWYGKADAGYCNIFTQSLVADYEGYDQMSLNYTLDGSAATHLVKSVSDDGTVEFEDPTPINTDNGYLLQKQAGRYYAMQFWERLLQTKNPEGTTKYYNANDCFSGAMSQMGVQTKFLQSGFNSDDPVAMLLDGSWWYNEATPTFNQMASIPGASKSERQIGIMPLPKPTADDLGEACYANNWITEVVIKSTIDEAKIPLAKAFLRFLHTDVSLSEFTRIANGVRPFDYSLTEADAAEATYYANQLMYLHKNATVVNPWSTNPLVVNNLSLFSGINAFNAIIGKDSYISPATVLREGVITGRQYFEGLSAFWTETRWKNTFGGTL